jgi:hypothetical protein
MACAFQLYHEEYCGFKNLCNSNVRAGTNGSPENVIAEERHGYDENRRFGAICGGDAVL